MKLILAVLIACAYGQDRLADVNQRGDHAMGFAHEKTTHHFRLYPDGGAIVIHGASLDALHAQPAGALTASCAVTPSHPAAMLDSDTLYEHAVAAPDCVTGIVCPATLSDA